MNKKVWDFWELLQGFGNFATVFFLGTGSDVGFGISFLFFFFLFWKRELGFGSFFWKNRSTI